MSTHSNISGINIGILTKNTTLDELKPPVKNVDFNNQNLINLKDPVNDKDGANKEYVDDSISTALVPYRTEAQNSAKYESISDLVANYWTQTQTMAVIEDYVTNPDTGILRLYLKVYDFNTYISNYTTTDDMNDILTLYLKIHDFNTYIGNYITTSTATATFQPKSLMSLYLLTSYFNTIIANYTTTDDLTDLLTLYLTVSNFNTYISNYYTKSQVDSLLSAYTNTSGLTTLLANYQLISGMSAYVLQTQLSSYYTKTQINSLLAGYYTQSQIDSTFANYQLISGMSAYVLQTQLSSYYTKSQVDSTFANYTTTSGLNTLLANYQPTSAMSAYYNKSQVDSTFTNYYTQAQIDSTFANYTTTSGLNTLLANYQPTSAMSAYYTKSQVDTTFTNYYTQAQINTTFANYTTTSGLSTILGNYQLVSGMSAYVLQTQLTGYYTQAQINTLLSGYQQSVSLDQIPSAQASLSLNSHKITNLSDGSSNNDAVNYGQLQAFIPTQIASGNTNILVSSNQLKFKINNLADQLIIQNSTGQTNTNTQFLSPYSQQFLSGVGSFSFTSTGGLQNNGLYVQIPDDQSKAINVQICVQATNANPMLVQNLTMSSGHLLYGGVQTPYSVICNQAGGLQQNLQISAGTPQSDNTLNCYSSSFASTYGLMGFQFTSTAGYAQTTSITNSNQFSSKAYVDAVSTNLSGNYYNKTTSDGKYALISTLSSYLTTASASSTYQTIANMSSYLTTSSASSTYQTIANMSNYLTTATASSTYQTIANMSNYVTNSSLTSTLGSYLTTASATATYLTQSSASATYQTISGMSSYLTTATAASTYYTKTTTLDALTAPTASLNMNAQKITNGIAATNPNDYVIYSQLSASTKSTYSGKVRIGVMTTLTTAQALSSGNGILGDGSTSNKIYNASWTAFTNKLTLVFTGIPSGVYSMTVQLLNNYNENTLDTYTQNLKNQSLMVQSFDSNGAVIMYASNSTLEAGNANLYLYVILSVL